MDSFLGHEMIDLRVPFLDVSSLYTFSVRDIDQDAVAFPGNFPAIARFTYMTSQRPQT
jgi:hypothetical protein